MSLGMVHGKQLAIAAAAGVGDGIIQVEQPKRGWPTWLPGAYEGVLVVGSIGLAASRVWPAAAPLFYGGLFSLSARGGRLVARKAGVGGPELPSSATPYMPTAGSAPYFPGMQVRTLRPRVKTQPAGIAA